MPGDPFYRSKAWKALLAAVWKRAKGRCEAPGCGRIGKVVDHIRSRKAGGPDALNNLRLLCRRHDNSVKERGNGDRARGGVLLGVDPSGLPCDNAHQFYAGGSSIIATPGAEDRLGAFPRSKLSPGRFRWA